MKESEGVTGPMEARSLYVLAIMLYTIVLIAFALFVIVLLGVMFGLINTPNVQPITGVTVHYATP